MRAQANLPPPLGTNKYNYERENTTAGQTAPCTTEGATTGVMISGEFSDLLMNEATWSDWEPAARHQPPRSNYSGFRSSCRSITRASCGGERLHVLRAA